MLEDFIPLIHLGLWLKESGIGNNETVTSVVFAGLGIGRGITLDYSTGTKTIHFALDDLTKRINALSDYTAVASNSSGGNTGTNTILITGKADGTVFDTPTVPTLRVDVSDPQDSRSSNCGTSSAGGTPIVCRNAYYRVQTQGKKAGSADIAQISTIHFRNYSASNGDSSVTITGCTNNAVTKTSNSIQGLITEINKTSCKASLSNNLVTITGQSDGTPFTISSIKRGSTEIKQDIY